jgi:hypothetical protein
MRAWHVVSGALLVAAAAACSNLAINPEYNSAVTNYTDPSFSRDIMPLLKQTCASSGGCHFGPNAAAGLQLDNDSIAYAHMVNVPSQFSTLPRVRPSRKDSSTVWLLLQDSIATRLAYYRMPVAQLMLPQETIDLIGNWVAQGAKNN